jgi:predicted negative regulator of RcsB-dependent stress response
MKPLLFLLLLVGAYFAWRHYQFTQGKKELVAFLCESEFVTKVTENMPTVNMNSSANDLIRQGQEMQQKMASIAQWAHGELMKRPNGMTIKSLSKVEQNEIKDFAVKISQDASKICPSKVSDQNVNVGIGIGLMVGLSKRM